MWCMFSKKVIRQISVLTWVPLLAISLSAIAQETYKDYIQEASETYARGEWSESVQAYAKAFATSEGQKNDLYNAACSAALAGQEKTALDYLEQSVAKGWLHWDHLNIDTDLDPIRGTTGWKKVIAQLDLAIQKKYPQANWELVKELRDIGEKDQRYRRIMGFGLDDSISPEEMKAYDEKQDALDLENLKRIEQIISKHGYPGKTLAGPQHSVAWLIIQHSDLAVQEKYLPLMTQAAEEGEIDKTDLALTIDCVLVGNGKPQIYGSQLTSGPDGKPMFHPIEDEANVDRRRAKIGLEKIADYAARFGLTYKGPSESKATKKN